MGIEIFPDRSENGTLRFPDSEPPENFLQSIRVVQVVASLCLPFYFVVIPIVIKSLRKMREENGANLSTGYFLLATLSLYASNTVYMIVMVSFKYEWETCRWVGGLGALLYFGANALSYFILLNRLRAVKVFKRGPLERGLLFAVKMGTYSVPLIALSSAFIFSGKLYFSTKEACVEDLAAFLSWLFLVMDSILSSGFLALFILPIWKHMKYAQLSSQAQVGTNKTNEKIHRVAMRNLILSSTAILSTFVFMVSVCIITEKLAKDESKEYSALRLEQYYGSSMDSVINSIVNLGIAMPGWQKKLRRVEPDTPASRNPNTNLTSTSAKSSS